MQKNILSYFTGSLFSFVIALPIGFWLAGFTGVWIVLLLSILEISLSLDNAVVNAKILQNWDQKWRRAFLVYGLPIAVFGMRLVFPILIVTLATGIGSMEVLNMAIYEPDQYSEALHSVHHQIAAFGGAFLMMVFLKFFMDTQKKVHWLKVIEERLTKIGQIEAIEVAMTIFFLFGVASFLEDAVEKQEFIVAGIWGIVVYIIAKGFGAVLGKDDENGQTQNIIKQGVAGFAYLELLDASFSFDGVVGAFALSNNLFIIATGLGVGALFVRSFTIYLVEKRTIEAYRYLEHGAFWAIGVLAMVMFFGVIISVPEIITGGMGALLIGLAVWQSYLANKRDLKK